MLIIKQTVHFKLNTFFFKILRDYFDITSHTHKRHISLTVLLIFRKLTPIPLFLYGKRCLYIYIFVMIEYGEFKSYQIPQKTGKLLNNRWFLLENRCRVYCNLSRFLKPHPKLFSTQIKAEKPQGFELTLLQDPRSNLHGQASRPHSWLGPQSGWRTNYTRT